MPPTYCRQARDLRGKTAFVMNAGNSSDGIFTLTILIHQTVGKAIF